MTKIALLGENIAYSKSAEIHNYIAFKYQISLDYKVLDIKEEALEHYISLLKKGVYQAFNMTIPFKSKIIKYLDKKSELVDKTNSCNLVYLKNGLVYGDNTDCYGFITLLKYQKINVVKKNIYILGTGATARGCAYVLNSSSQVIFVSRAKRGFLNNLKIISYAEIDYSWCDIIINATPAPFEPLNSLKIYIDLKYQVKFTLNNHYNGFVMLISQAFQSDKIIFNNEAINMDISDPLKLEGK